jgi:hypothetical protein
MKYKFQTYRNRASLILLMSLLTASTDPFRDVTANVMGRHQGTLFVDAPAQRPVASLLNSGEGFPRKRASGSFEAKHFRMPHNLKREQPFVAGPSQDQSSGVTNCNDGWHDGVPVNGIAGSVSAIAVDGAGNVYAGGWFKVAGNTFVNNIAKWDGSTWSALGSGTNDGVNSIAISGNDVYIGGVFTEVGGIAANYVAKWNGSSWSPVGSGPDHAVIDLKISGANIYVGGASVVLGESSVGHVSVWNGTAWSAMGPALGYSVSSIEISGSDIYAGGGIYSVGGVPANQIVKWNGSGWSNVGSGFNGYFVDLDVSGGDVYAAGSRSIGNGLQVGIVARWNGSTWSDLGSPLMNPGLGSYAEVRSVAVQGTDVYAAGYFSTSGGIPTRGIAKWNGANWAAVGSWGGHGTEVAISGGDVYFGGSFSSAGGVRRADGIAKWNGSNWSALGSGNYTVPNALTAAGTDVYGAGYFTADGGETVSRAAKWNGTGWTPLGTGPNFEDDNIPYIQTIAVSGSNVYIGGYLHDPATERNRGFVLRWNGSNWSELGSGMTNPPYYQASVNALAVSGGDIYAAGVFTTVGETPANHIARWNGTSWSPLGAGTNWAVFALSASGTDIYAGGEFTMAGGNPANKIAKWNGSTWSTLGDGPIDFRSSRAPESGYHRVTSIAASGSELYAGGIWDFSDYEDVGFVSKWEGSAWSDVLRTTSCCAMVNVIALSGTQLYAAGGIPGGLAKWNGSNWATTGFNEDSWGATGLAISGNEVFVGGSFWTAGCHVSAGFARYSPVPAAEVSVSGRVTTAGGRGIGNARVTMNDPYGGSRVTITSAFGYFRFDNVTVGQSYTVSIRSKRYSIQPRTIQVDSEMASVNFIGQ